MKIVSDLYKKVRDVNFYKNQFTEEPGKQNVIFADPLLSDFDFYSMIVPYLCLEETDRYKTALTGLYRYSEKDNIRTNLTEQEVRWSDAIVIPMSLEQFHGEGYLFDELRRIKPTIKIIQSVEFDYLSINSTHYLLKDHDKKHREEVKQKIIDRLNQNFASADRLLVMNHNLKNKLESSGFKDVKLLPTLIEADSFKENIDFQETLGVRNTPGIVFMSVEINEQTIDSFKGFFVQLKKLKDKYKENFRVVAIGENPNKYCKIPFEVVHVPKGSIVHQYKAVVKSTSDFHLILNKKNEYSTNSDTYFKFVEYGMFGIPVASLNMSPWNELIDDKVNGFLLKNKGELVSLVKSIIDDKTSIIEFSTTLKNMVHNTCQLTEDKINKVGSIIFDDYKTEDHDDDHFDAC
jgi:hypothetical protein